MRQPLSTFEITILFQVETSTNNFNSSISPSRHILVQSQQWKHQSNVWNLFKVNDKDIGTASLNPFWCFMFNFEQISTIPLVFLLFILNQNTNLDDPETQG